MNYLSNIRRDVLVVNKNTSHKGLTFLDPETVRELESLDYPSFEETKQTFDYWRKKIADVTDIVIEDTVFQASRFKGKMWERNFKNALSPLSEDDRISILHEDPIVTIALLCGANDQSQQKAFNTIASRHLNTKDWAIISCIVSSPLCDSHTLEHFGTGTAREKGYGYILRIIGRNPNTPRSTLESIVDDKRLDGRYTEVAVAALRGGNRLANDQV